MDELKAVLGVIVTIFTLLIGLAKLKHHERRTVWDWSKRLTLLFLYATFTAFSVYGFWTFIFKEGPITRGEVVLLFGHFFNLISYVCFFTVDLVKWYRVANPVAEVEKASAEQTITGQ